MHCKNIGDRGTAYELTWDEFVSFFRSFADKRIKKKNDSTSFFGGTVGDDPEYWLRKGLITVTKSGKIVTYETGEEKDILSHTLLVLDVDYFQKEIKDLYLHLKEILQCNFLIYSSFQSKINGKTSRFRLIIPLEKPIYSKEEHTHMVSVMGRLLGFFVYRVDGFLADSLCLEWHTRWYMPSKNKNSEFYAVQDKGFFENDKIDELYIKEVLGWYIPKVFLRGIGRSNTKDLIRLNVTHARSDLAWNEFVELMSLAKDIPRGVKRENIDHWISQRLLDSVFEEDMRFTPPTKAEGGLLFQGVNVRRLVDLTKYFGVCSNDKCSMLVYDFEVSTRSPQKLFNRLKQVLPCDFLIHTKFNHKRSDNQLRLFIPLEEPIDKSEYETTAKKVYNYLLKMSGLVVNPESYNPEIFWGFPYKPIGKYEMYYTENQGRLNPETIEPAADNMLIPLTLKNIGAMA